MKEERKKKMGDKKKVQVQTPDEDKKEKIEEKTEIEEEREIEM